MIALGSPDDLEVERYPQLLAGLLKVAMNAVTVTTLDVTGFGLAEDGSQPVRAQETMRAKGLRPSAFTASTPATTCNTVMLEMFEGHY